MFIRVWLPGTRETGPYVDATVQHRLPLISGFPGPTPIIAESNPFVGGMPSGSPPGTFGHGTHDLSKQTPPHHQSAHQASFPSSGSSASLGVNQQIATGNAGHNGPMQCRPATQGNNQFFGRPGPIRAVNQHMPRHPMTGVNQSPNATQLLPYPGQMNHQPRPFVIGDQLNNQSPYLSYIHTKSREEKENPVQKASTEKMLETVREILYKLTPLTFDKLLERIQALNISTEDRLSGVVKLFFEMVVDEPTFSSTYAKMCQALLTKEVACSANPAETTSFRKLLLIRCQMEFEIDNAGLVENKKKEVESAKTETKKKELEEELKDLVNIHRRRSLGNIRFLGELFKLRILSVKIMHLCILRLLSQPDDEKSLECLCRLLTTIGKDLETPMQPTGRSASTSSAGATINSYFRSLEAIVQERKISNRIRFMIQDVVDLRKRQWKPRHDDSALKTIEQIQIHRNLPKVREDQERELNNPQFQTNMGPMGGMSCDDRMGDGCDNRGGDRNRKQSCPSDNGWNRVNSRKKGGNAKLDMKQLWIPKTQEDADQGTVWIGPGGKSIGSWDRGASGGLSQLLIGGVGGGGTTREPRSNRYQILEDDSRAHESDKVSFSGRSSLGRPPPNGRGGYRAMPRATKSTFFPTKGEDRGLDSLRSQNSGKSTSSDDEIERKAHSVLGEFFTNEGIKGPQFLSKIGSTPRSGSVVSKSSDNVAPASLPREVYLEFQHSLEMYLRRPIQRSTDEICRWIKYEPIGEVSSAFIRALATAVIESSIEGRGTDSKLNNAFLKDRAGVLKLYVDNIAERELQLLFAVQKVVIQRQHPKGLL